LAATLALAATTARAQMPAALPPDLDQYVARVMKEFSVPGLALAVVKDGRVVLAKGYGARRLGDVTPVTPRTRFGIASNTKAFTATALGMLVEEGKLEWDAPVVRWLPGFAMYDPYVTRELTVRDLLVHRSGLGLGAGDLMWWPASTYDRKELVRRIRYIKPATSFRSAYAYDNVLYAVAGELIEAITGQSWEAFVSSRILAKLGMASSTVRAGDFGSDFAFPHAPVEGAVRPVAAYTSDLVNPAGGITTGAEDIAKWLVVQLDSGRLADGSRLWSPGTTRELWAAVTPEPISTPAPELGHMRPNFAGYALGFDTRDYRGRKLVTHTGGLPGFLSRLAMVPDARLGLAVLTNQESSYAFNAITYRIIDHVLGAAPVDYPAIYKQLEKQTTATYAAGLQQAAAARDSLSRPSLSIAKYAGTYSDAWYGDVAIAMEQGKLVIRMTKTPALVGDMLHWQHDTFIARWRDREMRADAFITFALNPDGTIDQAKMQAVSPETDFSFDFQDLLLKPAAPVRR
jgi:CubicO group peptidase (beta-lactamase class C family)